MFWTLDMKMRWLVRYGAKVMKWSDVPFKTYFNKSSNTLDFMVKNPNYSRLILIFSRSLQVVL